jgi:hypothetical protein
MIENITQGISYPLPPAMMSHAEMTYRAFGTPGPIIFFLDSCNCDHRPDMGKVDDL